MKYPILVITPSLDRNKSLCECLESLVSNSTGLADFFAVTRRTGGWIKALNSIPHELLAQYEIIGLVNDDVRMRTAGWDKLVYDRLHGTVGLVYGRDGIQDERLCTQPFFSASVPVQMGTLAPPCMEHSLVDNFYMEIFGRLGRLQYVPELFTQHYHYSVGTNPVDTTYEMGREAWNRDWPKWEEYRRVEIPKLIAKITL